MMLRGKTNSEIEKLKKSSILVGKTIAEVAKHIKPGVTTIELDKIAETYILDNGALPGFKGYRGFPGTLCISINDVVVHGIPGKSVIKEGDLVSIDCGTIIDGYYGDSAFSFGVEPVSDEVRKLLQRTYNSLYVGIESAKYGNRVGDIGYSIQSYLSPFNYGIVRDLVGHGIGKNMHEKPEVPNYGRRGTGAKLYDGLVICIEPMITLGTSRINIDSEDGWTIRTNDGSFSAHFEHAIAVKKEGTSILSDFTPIQEVENENIYIIKTIDNG